MSKLQRNSPTSLNVPKKKGNSDEGTESTKKSSTIVGQPELKKKTDTNRKGQLNERENGPNAYTD